jgi:predicted acetyltransferase
MTPEEVPDGYATYQEEDLTDEWGYKVVCSHLVAHTRQAALALFGYFRRFKGVGRYVEWNGPPSEPLALALPEQSARIVKEFRNMSRILDVPSAFEARGYPDVTGSATFSVEDPLFEDNTGTFLLEAHEGKVLITRQPVGRTVAGAPISIGALTTMFTGFVTPSTAAAMGLIAPDHPALGLFERLLAGTPPWTPDFF